MACVDDSVMASLVAIATTPRLRLQPTFNGSATTDYYATVPHSAILVHVRALTAHCRAEARINSVNGALRLVVDLPAFVPLYIISYYTSRHGASRFAGLILIHRFPLSLLLFRNHRPLPVPIRGYHLSLPWLPYTPCRLGGGVE